MTIFYSKSTNGFYDRSIHGDTIPADSIEITESEHLALLEGQSSGKVITTDPTGYPVLTTPAPAPVPTYAELRAAEYPPMADYLDGIVKGDTVQVQTYIDACLAVKAKYPKPV